MDKQKRKSYNLEFKVNVVEEAKKNGNRAAARKFGVDEKNIRLWRKQETSMGNTGYKTHKKFEMKARKRLPGAGRKRLSRQLDAALFKWIVDQREQSLRLTRRLIQEKAKELYSLMEDSSVHFEASNGWLQKFMLRNGLSLNGEITVTQKDHPDDIDMKISSYITYISTCRKSHSILNNSIIAMSEISIFFDVVAGTTDRTGSKSIIKSAGHKTNHATVALAANADGTKLKPFVVFKNVIHEIEELEEMPSIIVRSSEHGQMNQELTLEWLRTVYGNFAFDKRLLVWDSSSKYHISQKTIIALKKYNTVVALIPSGCAKYIHAPDVCWNKPFKEKIAEFYNRWTMVSESESYTCGEELRMPSKRLILKWIRDAWKHIPRELLCESFKACALSICLDGSEDNLIMCLRPGERCEGAIEHLEKVRLQGEVSHLNVKDYSDEIDNDNIIIIKEEDEENPCESSGNDEIEEFVYYGSVFKKDSASDND